MAATPDFDTPPGGHAISSFEVHARHVDVVWDDERTSGFHHVWLRDNCPCAACVHPGTREQMFEIVSVPPRIAPTSVRVADDGSLTIVWSDGHRSGYDAAWLRHHAYDEVSRRERRTTSTTWDAHTLAEPPTFDGEAVMVDDDALHEWLVALRTFGVSRVQHVPCTPDAIADLVARIGLVRETNFGVVWDVVSEPDPISNANTALALPPHVDLPTREYQPGLQFLHCLVNDAEGGDNILVDGFRIAEILRDEHPDDYEVLTTVPFAWANRSRTSDYRWSSPLIVTDGDGVVTEVRVGNWLRAPLDAPFDVVEACYAAYRRLFDLTYRSDLQLRFRLAPGEVMAFDNRRAMHARSAFTATNGGTEGGAGRRFLRGCYSERDELHSRVRMIERARRAREAAAGAAASLQM